MVPIPTVCMSMVKIHTPDLLPTRGVRHLGRNPKAPTSNGQGDLKASKRESVKSITLWHVLDGTGDADSIENKPPPQLHPRVPLTWFPKATIVDRTGNGESNRKQKILYTFFQKRAIDMQTVRKGPEIYAYYINQLMYIED